MHQIAKTSRDKTHFPRESRLIFDTYHFGSRKIKAYKPETSK